MAKTGGGPRATARDGDDGAVGRATTGVIWGGDDDDRDGLGCDRGGDGGEEQTETN